MDAPLQTTSKCAGCPDEISVFADHLSITVKTQKKALVTPPSPAREEGTRVEKQEESETYLGMRTGVGREFLFHDWKCAKAYFDKQKEKKVELRYDVTDDDPYNPEEEK